MLSNSDLFCMSKILTQQEAKETDLDGHAIMGKLIPVIAQEHLKYRADYVHEPFGSFPFALGSDIRMPQDHRQREEVTKNNLCADGNFQSRIYLGKLDLSVHMLPPIYFREEETFSLK